jgi:hypothetical protein
MVLDLPLVVESEWDPDPNEILWDFQKLLIARARLRVMVFTAPEKEVAPRFQSLRQAIADYSGTHKGDRYLLICWFNGRVEVQPYVVN